MRPMALVPTRRHTDGMPRPRLRHRDRSGRARLRAVPVGSLLPLWSLAGGFAADEDDEAEPAALPASTAWPPAA